MPRLVQGEPATAAGISVVDPPAATASRRRVPLLVKQPATPVRELPAALYGVVS